MLKTRSWSPLMLFAFAAVLSSRLVAASTVPSGFTDSTVATGLAAPTAMDFAPDGRLFVCEQSGSLRVIKNGVLLLTPFITLPVDSSGERGLLGVAFDPNFSVNRYIYLYHTVTSPTTHNQVSRFTASGDIAVPGSEVVILDLPNLSSATNHNGGAIHFGPDGYLYIGVGDNANGNNSQDLTILLGKLLRIASDGSIPTSNPFYNTATGVNRAIWAYGLRNPYTFSFQRGGSRMFINDVGLSTWEEVNDGIAGSNYGWPTTEGYTTDHRFVSPLFEYGHGSGDTLGCAITGGAFYDSPLGTFPAAYHGEYFFSDYCNGWIRVLNPMDNSVSAFATGCGNPVDLKVGVGGSLYYLDHGAGAVHRIEYNPFATRSDFNADTLPDLVLQNSTAQQAAFWFTNGATITGGAYAVMDGGNISLPPNWQVVAVADFNNDGRPDLVLENSSTGQIAFWFTNGSTVTNGVYATSLGNVITVPQGWQIVGAGDFNGDGHPDLVLENTTSHGIAFWFTAGTDILSSAYATSGGGPIGLPSGWQIAGIGDFNADGQPDLVLQNASSGQIAIWFMTDTAIASSAYATSGGAPMTLPAGWQIAGVGDYNLDGKPDLVLENLSTRQLAFWYTSGSSIISGAYAVSGGAPIGLPAGWQVAGPR